MTEPQPKKWAIVLVGPPGSGKGTQAELLAEDFSLIHLESSKVIEEKFAAAAPDDAVILREKETWRTGGLNTPKLVRQWIIERIELLAGQDKGIVFSGSPRTLYEAEGELPVLEKLYGRVNLKIVHIPVSEAESIKRNSSRRVCKANRHSIPNFPQYKGITACPRDGSEITTRALDTPETIKVRYATYLAQTEPVLKFFTEKKFPILKINGEQSIEAVHEDLVKGLHELHASMHLKILNKEE